MQIQSKKLPTKQFQIKTVRTRIDSNPEQEWIQAHVAQTINL